MKPTVKNFEIKDQEALLDGADALNRGDRAKLMFVGPTKSDATPKDAETGAPLPWKFGGEAMWVYIVQAKGGRYAGVLLSSPMVIDGQRDDLLVFTPRQIIEFKKAA